jgi:glycosyltransferase involved in cell wall biosynthesis
LMNVLIYEDDPRGHRLQFVRYLVEALAGLGVRPRLSCAADVHEMPEFVTFLAAVEESIEWSSIPAPLRSSHFVRRSAKRFWYFLSEIYHHRPEHVYVPFIDGLIYFLGLAGEATRHILPQRTQVEGILLRAQFRWIEPTPPVEQIKLQLLSRALRSGALERLHVLDEYAAAYLRKQWPTPLAERVVSLPDPAPSAPVDIERKEARRALELPEDRFLVLVAGGLTYRKGIPQILEAVASMDEVCLVLAGRADARVQVLLEQPMARRLAEEGRLITRLDFISDVRFSYFFRAADLVTVICPTHLGSSGILLHAAKLGRPVLGSAAGWIGETICNYHLGWVCEGQSRRSVMDGLQRARDSIRTNDSPLKGNRRDEFLAKHDIANFKDCLVSRLQDRLNAQSEEKLD